MTTDDEDDRPLTSDDIFKIMKYMSDNVNNKTALDISIFDPVRQNIPYLDETIDSINLKISMLHIPNYSHHQLAGFISNIRYNITKICTELKEKYTSIYPSKQILELIQLSRDSVSCLPILDHEKDLSGIIYLIKKCIIEHARKTNNAEALRLRVDTLRAHIYNLEEAYKRIYNLE